MNLPQSPCYGGLREWLPLCEGEEGLRRMGVCSPHPSASCTAFCIYQYPKPAEPSVESLEQTLSPLMSVLQANQSRWSSPFRALLEPLRVMIKAQEGRCLH